MASRFWPPSASDTALVSEGSTLKLSAMQEVATSMDSASSALRVPSLREVFRKSIIASASRFLDVGSEGAYASMSEWDSSEGGTVGLGECEP